MLLLHTDGLFEARSHAGDLFGEERLRLALQSAAADSAQAVVDAILAAVDAHAARTSDDRTLVALKRT